MTVRCFDVFKCQAYEYLEIARGNIRGNVVKSRRTLLGIFKDRDGMEKSGNVETYKADARIHIKPEDFPGLSPKQLIGNGIGINGQTYSIDNASSGTNFETGEIEHYRLDLNLAQFVEVNND